MQHLLIVGKTDKDIVKHCDKIGYMKTPISILFLKTELGISKG
jgi:hypothetical protein